MPPVDPAAPYLIDFVEVIPTGGRIGITPCPGTEFFLSGRESWEQDVAADFEAIARWGASAVVTLIMAGERTTPPLDVLRREAERLSIQWYHLPIMDGSVPDVSFEAKWAEIGPNLRALLQAGHSVLLHCLGGLGRSGLVAACLLVELGENPQRAIARVREARPGAIQTIEQEKYVLRHGAVRL